MGLALYDLAEEFKQIDNALEVSQGEMTEEQEKALASISELLAKKTDNCVEFYFSLEDTISAAKERALQIKNFIEACEKKKERFCDYISSNMDRMSATEIGGKLHKVKFRKPLQVIVITDEGKLPVDFIETEMKTKIKKQDIKNAIKSGQEVPGAETIDGKRSLIFKIGA